MISISLTNVELSKLIWINQQASTGRPMSSNLLFATAWEELIPIKASGHDSARLRPATAATGAHHAGWRNAFCDSRYYGLQGVRYCAGVGGPPNTSPPSLVRAAPASAGGAASCAPIHDRS